MEHLQWSFWLYEDCCHSRGTFRTLSNIYDEVFFCENSKQPVICQESSITDVLMANKINFISNNMEGFHSTDKRFKLIKYFRNKTNSDGFLFLQDTHSALKWRNNFKSEAF